VLPNVAIQRSAANPAGRKLAFGAVDDQIRSAISERAPRDEHNAAHVGDFGSDQYGGDWPAGRDLARLEIRS